MLERRTATTTTLCFVLRQRGSMLRRSRYSDETGVCYYRQLLRNSPSREPTRTFFFLPNVRQALEQVSVSTPRDLVRLGAFPDVLVGAVRERLGAERFTPLEGRITATAVESWRAKGDRLLEQRPWLELWVHEG